MTGEKKTPLYDEHVAAGAKMVPFAGYSMPVEYAGILSEHRAVRSAMGMFDLSHMGEFKVTGATAAEAVDELMTNSIANLAPWQVRYTPMCLDSGGIVDDLLVYRHPDHMMLVVNASNIDKDYRWVEEHLPAPAKLENISDDVALIAIQGPKAVGFIQSLTTVEVDKVPYYSFSEGIVAGILATLSRTGYTGEDGVELYVTAARAAELWRELRDKGEPLGLAPVGLGARDTLRLEAGLALYGNDIDESTTPLEAGLGWTVKLEGRKFPGHEAIAQQKTSGLTRRLVAFEMLDRSIPRPHFPVLVEGVAVGQVASGTFSPTFSQGLGLAYVPLESAKAGTKVEIEIRGQPHPAQVVKKPIYQRSSG